MQQCVLHVLRQLVYYTPSCIYPPVQSGCALSGSVAAALARTEGLVTLLQLLLACWEACCRVLGQLWVCFDSMLLYELLMGAMGEVKERVLALQIE